MNTQGRKKLIVHHQYEKEERVAVNKEISLIFIFFFVSL